MSPPDEEDDWLDELLSSFNAYTYESIRNNDLKVFHVLLNKDTRAYAFVTNASYNVFPKKVHQVYLMLIVGCFQFTSYKRLSILQVTA